jgi:solute:Na+ symporter, SSS family
VAVIVVASLTAPPQPAEQIRGLTYASTTPEQAAENRASWNRVDVLGSLAVLGVVVGIYVYFSFWLE